MAKADPQARTQKDIVVEFLESGILKPSEIVQRAQEKYGRSIPKPNVNQIKVQWKKRNSGLPNKNPTRGRPSVGGLRRASSNNLQSRSEHGISELELAKFALRLGGVDNAIEALRNLVK